MKLAKTVFTLTFSLGLNLYATFALAETFTVTLEGGDSYCGKLFLGLGTAFIANADESSLPLTEGAKLVFSTSDDCTTENGQVTPESGQTFFPFTKIKFRCGSTTGGGGGVNIENLQFVADVNDWIETNLIDPVPNQQSFTYVTPGLDNISNVAKFQRMPLANSDGALLVPVDNAARWDLYANASAVECPEVDPPTNGVPSINDLNQILQAVFEGNPTIADFSANQRSEIVEELAQQVMGYYNLENPEDAAALTQDIIVQGYFFADQ